MSTYDVTASPSAYHLQVYWPTWLTHVVLDLRKPAKANVPLVVGIEECLPGHSFSPLSLLDLPVQDDNGPEGSAVGTLVYDETSAKDQLHEYGQSIEIIPFSVDPTKVRRHILRAKKLYEQGQTDTEWTVLSETKEVMVSARPIWYYSSVCRLFAICNLTAQAVAAPIYFPLYIAEWTRPKIDSFPERKVTVVVSGQYDGLLVSVEPSYEVAAIKLGRLTTSPLFPLYPRTTIHLCGIPFRLNSQTTCEIALRDQAVSFYLLDN